MNTSTQGDHHVTTFWDEYAESERDPSRLLYLTAQHKLVLVESGAPFDVTSVTEGSGRYGSEFDVSIQAGDTVKVMSFAAGYEGRDHKLKAMQAWLADHPFDAIRVKLVKDGRMFDLIDGRDGSEPRPSRSPSWTGRPRRSPDEDACAKAAR
jgi:hypothetical protein